MKLYLRKYVQLGKPFIIVPVYSKLFLTVTEDRGISVSTSFE
jgi:hypothetical protein